MRNPTVAGGGGAPLPSHLSMGQAARLLGITRSAVGHRVRGGTLPSVDIFGYRMIPTMAVLADDALPSLVALTPEAIIEVANEANEAIRFGEADKPMFSALQVAGVYLGLSRLPWPSPAPAEKGAPCPPAERL